jgi:ribonuclease HI
MKSFSKIIYCDGSSLGNPGPGGFGVVALDVSHKVFWEFGEGFKNATNNQMELAATIFSLNLILKSHQNDKKNLNFEIRTDSKYVIQGSTEWLKNWVKNNWKNSQKKEVLNKGEWQKILGLLAEIETRKIKIKWTHVYGHTGEKWNERVDEIAKSFAGGEKLKLAKAEKY